MCHIDKLTNIGIIIELLHIFHDFLVFLRLFNSICIKKYILCSNILDFASLVVRAGGGRTGFVFGCFLFLSYFCSLNWNQKNKYEIEMFFYCRFVRIDV